MPIKRDKYQRQLDHLLPLILEGHIPWRKKFSRGTSMPCNHESGRPYSGSNIITCWVSNWSRGFTSNRWVTFNQARRLGFQWKGESGSNENKGTPYIWVKPSYVNKQTGEEKRGSAGAGTIYNIEQFVGITDPQAETYDHGDADVGAAIKIPKALNVPIEKGDPSYSPIKDRICMLDLDRFTTPEAFMSILAHESCHATGHKSRLDRDQTHKFGTPEYAYEELIAELGAAFICAEWGIEYGLENHASYLQSWVTLLQDKPKALHDAAVAAGKAVDFIRKQLVAWDLHAEHSASLSDLLEYGEDYATAA